MCGHLRACMRKCIDVRVCDGFARGLRCVYIGLMDTCVHGQVAFKMAHPRTNTCTDVDTKLYACRYIPIFCIHADSNVSIFMYACPHTHLHTQAAFKMARADFMQLPQWRRDNAKKALRLF